MTKKQKFVCALRAYRRHHWPTKHEQLLIKYQKLLWDLIEDPDREKYWSLWKMTPEQASEKGLI